MSGKLEAFPVANVLQFLGGSRSTGILSLSSGERRIFVTFEDGQIVAVSAGLGRRRPKRAAYSELDEAGLMRKASEVLAEAMTWPQGQFSFGAGGDCAVRQVGTPRPRLSAESVLMNAAFSLDEELRVG
jgi:hypothetical protein